MYLVWQFFIPFLFQRRKIFQPGKWTFFKNQQKTTNYNFLLKILMYRCRQMNTKNLLQRKTTSTTLCG